MAERHRFAHLLRRATFGPTAEEVDEAERLGYDDAVDAVVSPIKPDRGAAATPRPQLGPDPLAALDRNATRDQRLQAQQARRDQTQTITAWWVERMVAAEHQFAEKLIFFWHGHWATSVVKVDSAQLMLAQQEVFRRHGQGEFGPFVKAMLRDAALIRWLDGQLNTRQAPNENLARELMELFTLGIGNYTEDDVKQGARALTGWVIDRPTGQVRFEPKRFDDGQKTILRKTANFNTDSYVDLLLSQPAAGEFLARRLWFRFATGEPTPAEALARMTFAGFHIAAMAKAMFRSPAFVNTRGELVKQPVEWLAGAMRQLEARPDEQLVRGLTSLDQVPFRPPSVGGWPSGAQWLTTFSAQTRLRLSEALATKASKNVIDRLSAAPVPGRADALARLLVVDAWTDRTRKVLTDVAAQPRKLIALGLASPEYAVH